MENIDLVIGAIKDLKTDNQKEHDAIGVHLSKLNGSVARIKTKQIAITYTILGILIALTVMGYIPEQVIKLTKLVF